MNIRFCYIHICTAQILILWIMFIKYHMYSMLCIHDEIMCPNCMHAKLLCNELNKHAILAMGSDICPE